MSEPTQISAGKPFMFLSSDLSSPVQFRGEPPSTHRLSKWWILIIIAIIIIVIIIVIWIRRQNSTDQKKMFTSNNYFLVWADDFHRGTSIKSKHNRTEHVNQTSPANIYCRKNDKCLPNVEKWTSQVVIKNDHHGSLITNNLSKNISIRNKKLILSVSQPSMASKIISRAAFTYGFFAIRARINQPIGSTARIHLLPYYNVAMNQIGSDYGRWPACGEIEYLRTEGKDLLGGVYFGSNPSDDSTSSKRGYQVDHVPKDDHLTRIDLTKYHTFGLEWTPNYISWHLGSDVCPDGKIGGGKILQKVTKDEWYSLDCDGKKRFPPAPFDQPFHLILSFSSNLEAKMEVDWIKVYQHPSKPNYRMNRKLKEDSDNDHRFGSDNSDDEDEYDHQLDSGRKPGPMGF